MKSRYGSKLVARGRDKRTTVKAAVKTTTPLIPRELKQRITDLILTGRDKRQFEGREFGCPSSFLPGMVVEVVWRIAIPHDLPRSIRFGKEEYRLVHRMWKDEEGYGHEDPRYSLSNGYKWQWWRIIPSGKADKADPLISAFLGQKW